MDLLGELSAGRRGADHQHAAVRKLLRLPVVPSATPEESRLRAPAPSPARNGVSQAPVATTTARERHSPAVVETRYPPAVGSTSVTSTPAMMVGADRLRVKLEIGGECAGRHEGVGIVPVIWQAGKSAHAHWSSAGATSASAPNASARRSAHAPAPHGRRRAARGFGSWRGQPGRRR